jgi:hypothetical protein
MEAYKSYTFKLLLAKSWPTDKQLIDIFHKRLNHLAHREDSQKVLFYMNSWKYSIVRSSYAKCIY